MRHARGDPVAGRPAGGIPRQVLGAFEGEPEAEAGRENAPDHAEDAIGQPRLGRGLAVQPRGQLRFGRGHVASLRSATMTHRSPHRCAPGAPYTARVTSTPTGHRVGERPIGPYERRTAEVHPWDPRTVEVARRVIALITERRPDLVVEHIGSTALAGPSRPRIVDVSIETQPAEIPGIVAMLYELGFGPQPGPDPWPATRPMPVGAYEYDGTSYRIHLHVQPVGGDMPRDLAFRDALRNDPELKRQYTELKEGITAGGAVDGFRYTHSKTTWILGVYRKLGYAPPAILPPATIRIIGGGQIGRLVQ